jgi:hypothetical protein
LLNTRLFLRLGSRLLSGSSLAKAELLHASCRIEHLLGLGIERMALRTDFDIERWEGRTHFKASPAGAGHFGLSMILGVDFFLHKPSFGHFTSFSILLQDVDQLLVFGRQSEHVIPIEGIGGLVRVTATGEIAQCGAPLICERSVILKKET